MAFDPNALLSVNDAAWKLAIADINAQEDAHEPILDEMEAILAILEGGGVSPLIPNPNLAQSYGPADTVYRVEDVGASVQTVSWKYNKASHRVYLGGIDATMADSVYATFGNQYANFYRVVAGTVTQFSRGSANVRFDTGSLGAGAQMDLALDTSGLKLYVAGALVHTVPATNKDYPESSLQTTWPDAAPGRFAAITQTAGIVTPTPTTGTAIPGVVLSGGSTNPLIVKAMRLDDEGYPLWDIVYNDTPEAGYGIQIQATDGSIVKASAVAEVVKNPSAGIATLRGKDRAADRGTAYDYVLQRLNGSSTAPTITRTERRTLPPVPTVGTNVRSWTEAASALRIYKNLLRQSYIQNTNERNSDGGFDVVNCLSRPDLLDDANNPLANGLWYQTHVPHGTYTMEITWTDSDMTLTPYNYNTGGVAEALQISNVVKGTRSTRFDVVCDRSKATSHALFVTLATGGIGSAKPKNLHCHIVGETYSLPGVPPFANGFREDDHFHPAYVAYERRLGGYHRFMDALKINLPQEVEPYVAWSKRSRIHRIASQPCGPSLEEMILFSKLTDRPLWWNISAAYCYSPAGRDTISRSAKMLDAGTESDLGYGLPAGQKFKAEGGNEDWNTGLRGFHYRVQKAQESGRWTTPTTNGNADINFYERVYQHVAVMKIIMAAVPNYGSRVQRILGVQMGRGDTSGLRGVNKTAENNSVDKVTWADCQAVTDRFAKAPYVPGDPYANFSATDQPKSASPADVVAWADTYVDNVVATLNSDIQWNYAEFGLPTDLYEWNYGQPAIKFKMSVAEVRALKNSAVFRTWMRERVFPGLLPNGGDSCIYYGTGFPDGGSWQAFEAFWPGAGNGTMDELVAYNQARGWRVPA